MGQQQNTLHVVTRSELQRAVGRTPLSDVLRSLKRSRLVVRYRVGVKLVRIETRSTLGFLFGAFDRVA